ncbi:c-type cytochrome [Rhodoferax sp. 4810]|nr:c-type cytochrome [Rhodoferax jenense]
MNIPNRFLACTAAHTLGLMITLPATAQPATARSTPHVDLQARLLQAKDDPKLAEKLLATGAKVATFCANCHGANGNSANPTIPNLAAQHPGFLLAQLRKFADGTRRNEFMEGMIKALNADEKVGAALFYSGQKLAAKPAANPALAAKGKDIFSKNCFRCHGDNGLGDETYARIAGQQSEYLKLTLQRYKSGNGIRVDPLMDANTRLLSDGDMDAVVAYVSSLPYNSTK